MTDVSVIPARICSLEYISNDPVCTIRPFVRQQVALQEATIPGGAKWSRRGHYHEKLVIASHGDLRLKLGADLTPAILLRRRHDATTTSGSALRRPVLRARSARPRWCAPDHRDGRARDRSRGTPR